MNKCKICEKELNKTQKSTCSQDCKAKYVATLNRGRPSPFKGKPRWSEEQKKEIGDRQRGILRSGDFKLKCSLRMKGKSFFKGHKQSERQKQMMRERGGINHYNYQGKNSTGEQRTSYLITLRRRKNGWTRERFENTLFVQNNKCAICEKTFDESVSMLKKAADHCHANNSPRGILCRKCNLMLGNAEDNRDILRNAIKYLDNWRTA